MQVDQDGYRLGVGFILQQNTPQQSGHGLVLVAERMRQAGAWQFPQGGMLPDESPVTAMYRELYEELGLRPEDVVLQKETTQWYRYDLPSAYQVIEGQRVKGQKQRWFLLSLLSDERHIQLDRTDEQEFSAWRWVHYKDILQSVVAFKRPLYQAVLAELFG